MKREELTQAIPPAYTEYIGKELREAQRRGQGNGAQKSGVAVGHAAGWRIAAEAMNIDWMKREELTQAIPPAYTEYVGSVLIQELEKKSSPGVVLV